MRVIAYRQNKDNTVDRCVIPDIYNCRVYTKRGIKHPDKVFLSGSDIGLRLVAKNYHKYSDEPLYISLTSVFDQDILLDYPSLIIDRGLI